MPDWLPGQTIFDKAFHIQIERFRCDRKIDQARLLRLRSRKSGRFEDHTQRAAEANHARQPLSTPPGGNEPELHFREAELGLPIVAGDAVMASKCELEPTSQAGAVDHGYGREGKSFNTIKENLAGRGNRVGFFFRPNPLNLSHIGPGEKTRFLAAAENGHPRRIAFQPRHDFDQLRG